VAGGQNSRRSHLRLAFDAREMVVVAGISGVVMDSRCHFVLVVRLVTQWEWGVEDKKGDNKPQFSSWLIFSRRTFCLLISTLP